jgi:hypothetical protein
MFDRITPVFCSIVSVSCVEIVAVNITRGLTDMTGGMGHVSDFRAVIPRYEPKKKDAVKPYKKPDNP